MEMPNIWNLTTLARSYFADPTHLLPRDPRLIKFALKKSGFQKVSVYTLNDHPTDDHFIEEMPPLGTDKQIGNVVEITRHIQDGFEKNFSRLNDLFYTGMDVAFQAVKTISGAAQ